MRWFFHTSNSSTNSTPPAAAAADSSSSAALPPSPLSNPIPTTETSSAAAAETSSSSQDDTPTSRSTAYSHSTSTAISTIDLSKEYKTAVQTSSYNDIWDKLHQLPSSPSSYPSSSDLLDHILHPNHQSIHQSLQFARPTNLTRLVSAYFDNSEQTSKLCLLLQRSVDHARRIYAPLHDFLQLLPPNSPTIASHSQLEWALAALSDFDLRDNPFRSDANFQELSLCFSRLNHQLKTRVRKAHHRVRVIRRTNRCVAVCLIGTAVGVAASAVVVATHALAAIVLAPFFACLPRTDFANRHIAQLDAAARGMYFLNMDLDTIDRLVARLHETVESDKRLVRLGLRRGKEMFPIQEVLKHLQKHQPNFLEQLNALEEHVCLCFAAVNRARSLLLEQIHLFQASNSDPQSRFCFDNWSSSDSASSDH